MFRRGFKSWCERAAVEKRSELQLRPDDPLSPWKLAARMGITIWHPADIPGLSTDALHVLLKGDPDGWSAVTLRLDSKDLVILNSAHSPARQASDLMHEISHMLLAHRPSRVDVTEDMYLLLRTHDATQEDEAVWLSGCLLLPRPALLSIQRKRDPDPVAAQSFGVSVDMLTYRRRMSGVEIQAKRARSRGYASSR